MINSDDRLARNLNDLISKEMSKYGLFCRVFSRAKTQESINNKIALKGEGYYSKYGKKIQDSFGVRIVLYFNDDISLAQKIIEDKFLYIDSQIDKPNHEIFSATRYNCVYRLPENIIEESHNINSFEFIDTTFEVQYRTILSEGWHEVEHDLRYKCKPDWEKHKDLDRTLNGIFASLETSDWGMLNIFEDLSYRFYKSSSWDEMIRHKFRLRMTGNLSQNISKIINEKNLGKKIFRISRSDCILKILSGNFDIPITPNNIIYLLNWFYLKDIELKSLTPSPIHSRLLEAEQF